MYMQLTECLRDEIVYAAMSDIKVKGKRDPTTSHKSPELYYLALQR
jgi:hypothetical protein